MSVGNFATTMSAIDPSTGQLVELPFDQNNYVIQDGSVLTQQLNPTSQGGKSLLRPELAQHLGQHSYKSTLGRGGFTMATESRWGTATSPKTNRALNRKPGTVGLSQGGPPSVQTSSGILSLGSRYTPSSASVFGPNLASLGGGGAANSLVPNSMGVDRDPNYRLASAMAGTTGRGRPRGRRPLRGQFPVVPIDMVRQLGIEQQVILQPAAPVAMRNKAVLCRPLSMCRKTQVSMVQVENAEVNGLPGTDEMEDITLKRSSRRKEVQDSQVDIGVNTLEETVDPIRRKTLETGVSTDTSFMSTDECSQTETVEPTETPVTRIQYIPIPIPVPIFVPAPVCLYARPVPYTLPFPLPCPIPFPVIPKDFTMFGERVLETAKDLTTEIDEPDSTIPKRPSSLLQESHSLPMPDATEVEQELSTDEQPDQLVIAPEPSEPEKDVVSGSAKSLKRPASPSLPSDDIQLTDIQTETQNVTQTSQFTVPETTPNVMTAKPAIESRVVEPPVKKPRHAIVVSDANYHLKFSYGINAWRHWVQHKLSSTQSTGQEFPHLRVELLNMSATDLNAALSQFVREVRKPNGECYVADSIFYLCLGIQEYLNENGHHVNVFGGRDFTEFIKALDDILANFQPRINPEGLLVCRIEEEHLWEAEQLGQHTPEILLFTILYFNTKHLGLRHGEVHRRLAFWQYQFIDEPVNDTAVLCHLSSGLYGTAETGTSTTVRLDANSMHPERCPVKLLRNYCSRCPPVALSSEDAFYLTPIDPTPEGGSGSWYSTVPVDSSDLQVMLNRIKMVKEIQEAFMNGQPDCGF